MHLQLWLCQAFSKVLFLIIKRKQNNNMTGSLQYVHIGQRRMYGTHFFNVRG